VLPVLRKAFPAFMAPAAKGAGPPPRDFGGLPGLKPATKYSQRAFDRDRGGKILRPGCFSIKTMKTRDGSLKNESFCELKGIFSGCRKRGLSGSFWGVPPEFSTP